MKKKRGLILLFVVMISIVCIAIVSNRDKGGKINISSEITDNIAEIHNEARPLDSYSDKEVEQYPELQNIFEKVKNVDTSSTAHKNIQVAYGDLYTSTVITSYAGTIIYRSLPRLVFTVSDIGTAGSSNIACQLDIIESVNVNGEVDMDWQNAIIYKNISSEISCGDNTNFTSNLKLKGETRSDTRNFMQVLFGADKFSNAIRSRDSKKNYRVDMRKEELNDTQHYLNMMSSMSTVDSSKTENHLTHANTQWSFDVYFYRGSLMPVYNNVIITCDTEYLVNLS